MAADYIVVNRGKQPGNSLVRAADMAVELRNLIAKLQAEGNHMNDNGDYSVMEVNFGLASGSGANTLTLINIMSDLLNTNTETAGDVRLGQINEFCARIAGQ